MKKIIFLLTIVFAANLGFAQIQLGYTTATTPTTNTGFTPALGVSYQSCCIYFNEGQMANYAGSTLHTITTYISPLIAGSLSYMQDWTGLSVWVKNTLDGAFVLEQDVTSEVTLGAINNFVLDVPYVIPANAGLVIGMTIQFTVTTSTSHFPFGIWAPSGTLFPDGAYNTNNGGTNANAHGEGAVWTKNTGRALLVWGKISGTTVANDLCAVSMESVSLKWVGNPSTSSVWVFNSGTVPQNNFEVQLLGNSDILLGSTTVSTALAAGAHQLVNVTFNPAIAGDITLKGKIVLAGDQISSNNVAPQQLTQYVSPMQPMAYCDYSAVARSGYSTTLPQQAAIQYPAAGMSQFADKCLTAIRVAFGEPASTLSDCKIWIADTLTTSMTYLYEQSFTPVDGWNTIVLNTPYPLTSSEIFIGYSAKTTGSSLFGSTANTPVNLANAGYIKNNTLAWTTLGGLGVNRNLCIIGVVDEDHFPPVPGENGVITGTTTAEEVQLQWEAATDIITPQLQLNYFVYQSSDDDINTVADCETNGTLLNPVATQNITNYNVTGLTPNTAYFFNVVVVDNANNKAAYVSKGFTTEKATLTGTVSISGNAVYGETLSATTNLTSMPVIPDLGIISYQWKRDGVDIGGNSTNYTIVAEDVAHTITVTVTAENCKSSITSTATSPVQKATQTAPSAPTAANITSSGITLNVITDCEYRMNGGSWQSSPVFAGLQPQTTYGFEARKQENATHSASAPSYATYITTEVRIEVLNVEISPKTITVLPNQMQQFTAIVSAVGGADESVTWSISGQTSLLTKITSDGLLTIGINEIADTITVKVVSIFNPTLFDEATVSTNEIGVEPIMKNELRIYPNPTTGQLTMDNGQLTINSIEIFDVFGKKQLSILNRSSGRSKLSEDNCPLSIEKMDISNLSNGVYFLKITIENGVLMKKVVKQ